MFLNHFNTNAKIMQILVEVLILTLSDNNNSQLLFNFTSQDGHQIETDLVILFDFH